MGRPRLAAVAHREIHPDLPSCYRVLVTDLPNDRSLFLAGKIAQWPASSTRIVEAIFHQKRKLTGALDVYTFVEMQSMVEATKGEGEVYKVGLQSPSQTQRRCII